ncbi:nuclear pore complex protein Nup133-like [Sycon ciliatum]|uniref:nuclear pore complex protein Nup133-like n=1 Tax=Sycon ciliatum TaxID=27933 RepID=UPI0020AED596|eukprot:scpid18309/ scgid11390/ Nuclear pore complex protein Nup133; 133 kDa nucleoporin; Nucleoporin Nup133
MFTPQSAPRHRSVARAGFASSPLARSPMVSSWRGGGPAAASVAAASPAKPGQGYPAGRSHVYSIDSSHCSSLKLLKSSLPPSVAELAPSYSAEDVVLHSTGWAWLVTRQHQLVLWRYDQLVTKQGSRPLRPIGLPSSTAPYGPAQVCIFSTSSPSSGDESWGVVAVSSSGHVRCWTQWPKSFSSSDIQIDLPAGHSCTAIVDCMPHGCVVVTQKGDLFLLSVSPDTSGLTWRSLYSRSGTLAGLRRRVSSLFFSSAAEEDDGQYTLAALVSDEEGASGDELNIDRSMVVLSETCVEKWNFTSAGEKQISSVDLNSLPVKEAIAEQIVEAQPDVNVSFDGLHLHAKDALIDKQLVYVLVSVSDHSTVASSVKAEELFVLGFSMQEGSQEKVLLARQITLSSLDALRCLSSWRPRLVRLATAGAFDVTLLSAFADRHVDVNSTNGKAVNAVQPLFDLDLAAVDGGDSRLLVVLVDRSCLPSPEATASARTVAESSSSASSGTVVSVPPSSELSRNAVASSSFATGGGSAGVSGGGGGGDRYMQLRSAFLTFCQSESQNQCKAACQCLFPTVTAELDRALIQLSCELINDRGVNDPRWAERTAMTANPLSTASLLSAQQDLNNTQNVHDMFLQFVIAMEWWDKLGVVANGDQLVATELVLGEHSEKVAAAAALVSHHCKHPGVLDQAVEHALSQRESAGSATTSPHHKFYHQVEHISDIIASLVECLRQQLAASVSSAGGSNSAEQDTELFLTTNTIVEAFLSSAHQQRVKTYVVFSPSVLQRGNQSEYLPWTASSGNAGARASLLRLFTLVVERAIPAASRSAVQQDLFAQLSRLADNILDGFRIQLLSAKSVNVSAARLEELQGDMESARRQIIQPFLDHGQRETARQLAERYGDFAALISLDESSSGSGGGGDDHLMSYMCKFAEQGFAEYVFKYYLDQGKLAKLLSQPAALHQKLTAFLEPHTKLKWLHCLGQGDFNTAYSTLRDLADDETVYLSKKKTLLSLSKLSYLASDHGDDGDAETITVDPNDHIFMGMCNNQELIALQESMPEHIRENLQLDFGTMRPLLPSELIDALIGDGNAEAEPEDFLRALDVLRLLNPSDEERLTTCCVIWGQALLKEQAFWQSVDESEQQDSVAKTVFCRTVRAMVERGDIAAAAFLPEPALLLESELLAPLQLHSRPAVCFWLQAAYDHVINGDQVQQ